MTQAECLVLMYILKKHTQAHPQNGQSLTNELGEITVGQPEGIQRTVS